MTDSASHKRHKSAHSPRRSSRCRDPHRVGRRRNRRRAPRPTGFHRTMTVGSGFDSPVSGRSRSTVGRVGRKESSKDRCMSLPNAILIGTGAFVFVTLAWAIILRLGLAGLIEEFSRQRQEQENNAKQNRDSLEQSHHRLVDRQARMESNQQRSDENRARQDIMWTRSQQREERWDALLSRIEALVQTIEQKYTDQEKK